MNPMLLTYWILLANGKVGFGLRPVQVESGQSEHVTTRKLEFCLGLVKVWLRSTWRVVQVFNWGVNSQLLSTVFRTHHFLSARNEVFFATLYAS